MSEGSAQEFPPPLALTVLLQGQHDPKSVMPSDKAGPPLEESPPRTGPCFLQKAGSECVGHAAFMSLPQERQLVSARCTGAARLPSNSLPRTGVGRVWLLSPAWLTSNLDEEGKPRQYRSPQFHEAAQSRVLVMRISSPAVNDVGVLRNSQQGTMLSPKHATHLTSPSSTAALQTTYYWSHFATGETEAQSARVVPKSTPPDMAERGPEPKQLARALFFSYPASGAG